MKYLIVPPPDAYVAIEEVSGNIKRYFLDVLDDLPPKFLRRRVNQYFTFYDLDEWQDSTNKPFPEIILICPTKRMKNHLYYYIQGKIEYESDLKFYLSTWETIKKQGFNREVLQRVEVKD